MEEGDVMDSEAWIDARLAEFQELASGKAPPPVEAFVARAGGDAQARRLLAERLARLAHIEGRFARMREEAIRPGVRLGDFEVLALLGQGGMGRVYRARQHGLEREVALKVPLWGTALDEAGRERFLREARAVAQLRNPNIVPLHQVGEHEGTPFLVFELVEALSLARVLADIGPKRPRDGAALGRPGMSYEHAVASVGIEILAALSAAHEAGIVHRDVKPGNVLLEPSGRIRVVDFGLARLKSAEPLTASDEVLGTMAYLAPEVLRGAAAAGPWSDLYSVGVLLYELLALQRPFEAPSPAQTVARIERGEPTPLALRTAVPVPLSAVVEKGMARSIERRYPGADAFASDLRAFVEGREVSARPSTRLRRLGRRALRHPVATASALLLFVLGSSLLGLWQSRAEVRAAMNRVEAIELARSGLLWRFADAEVGGRPTRRTVGREKAVSMLRRALELDPDLLVARVELPQLLLALGRVEEAARSLEALEPRAPELRTIAWTRAGLRDPAQAWVAPGADEALVTTTVHDLDRPALARSLLNSWRSEEAMKVLRPIEDDPVLGPMAQYLQFECCHTRHRRDAPRAIAYLRAALGIVPDHPVLLGNLFMVLDSWATALPAEIGPGVRPAAEADLAALLPRLERAEEEAPWLAVTWLAHGAYLGRRDDPAGAEAVLRRGLAVLPSYPVLTHMLAQTRFRRWVPRLEAEETPLEEVLEVTAMLEDAIEQDDSASGLYLDLAYVHYLNEDCGAVLHWGTRARALLPETDGIAETEKGQIDDMMAWARGDP